MNGSGWRYAAAGLALVAGLSTPSEDVAAHWAKSDHHSDSNCRDADGWYEHSRCHSWGIMHHNHGEYQCEETSATAETFWGEAMGIENLLKAVGARLPAEARRQAEKMLKDARDMSRVTRATASHLCY